MARHGHRVWLSGGVGSLRIYLGAQPHGTKGRRVPPLRFASELRSWIAGGVGANHAVWLEIYEWLGRSLPKPPVREHIEGMADELVEAFEQGRLVALQDDVALGRAESPNTVREAAPPAWMPEATALQFLRVLVFDSAGDPIPSLCDPLEARVDVRVTGGPRYAALPVTTGMAEVDGVPNGLPSACSATFSGIATGTDFVPADAPPTAAPKGLAGLVRGSLEGPVMRTRRELADPQTAWLGATTVFQLRRRAVSVVELEHFDENGAILWPGLPLEPAVSLLADAPRVRGIDALRAVLETAPSYDPNRIYIAGHHATVSQERADGVLALLVGDDDARKRWCDLAKRLGTVRDQQAILHWSATELGWPCDPGPLDGIFGPKTEHAIRSFQRAYNKEVGTWGLPKRAALEVDGSIGPHTWGAMFDALEHALRGPSKESLGSPAHILVDDRHQTYPFELAALAAPGRDGNAWRALNPLNPSMVRPDGAGWYWPHVGQKIFLPETWSLQALLDAGYEGAPAASAQFEPAALQALPATGPKATGVGKHHSKAPFVSQPKRRTSRRGVDVIFADAGEEPEHVCSVDSPSPCTHATCDLYDPREFDFTYVEVTATPGLEPVAFRIRRLEDDSPVAHAHGVVLKPDGTLLSAIADGDGFIRLFGHAGDVFRLLRAEDPRQELHLVTARHPSPIGEF
jgi:peptidoglycan hydrolase-like protein with peptidoglycan-binding domain